MKSIILKYSAIILPFELIVWYLREYTSLNIPEYFPIPGIPPVSVSGTLLMAAFITVLILSQKQILIIDPNTSVYKLTFTGTAIAFLSETVCQTIKQLIYIESIVQHINEFLHTIIGLSMYVTFISFLVAFQLKTKKTRVLIVFIVVFIIVCNIVMRLFPGLIRGN